MASEIVELEGHIVDSLLLAKVLDQIVESEADYRIIDFELGRRNIDPSRTTIEITADDESVLDALLEPVPLQGVHRPTALDAVLVSSAREGVLPDGFSATTNLATDVRVDGRWRSVENPEMDCGTVVTDTHVRTVAMHRVHVGDRIVVGFD